MDPGKDWMARRFGIYFLIFCAEIATLVVYYFWTAFPVSTCFTKKALLEFGESIHHANANSEYNWDVLVLFPFPQL